MCLRGDVKIPLSRMTKDLQGNIDRVFFRLLRQVTKSHLHHLLVVSDCCVLYGERAKYIL